MSYNNTAVMTAKPRRRRRGVAQVQSMGRAASDRRKPASGETADGRDEGRSDFMVDDHDPLDASAALAAADEMMRLLKGGAR
jgi:hypothetical protein